MGTSNFYYENDLNIIGDDFSINTEEDGEGYIMYCDGVIYNIQSSLENYKNKHIYTKYKYEEYIHNYPISNNYGGKSLYKINISNNNYEMSIIVIMYNGYYSHSNIDYITDTIIYNDAITEDDILNYKYIQKIIDDVRKIIRKYTTEYIKVATFSNGETIYNKKLKMKV